MIHCRVYFTPVNSKSIKRAVFLSNTNQANVSPGLLQIRAER